MAAYLEIVVEGNEDFGGYLSFDGQSSILLQDGMIYEIDPGVHSFVIHSNSDGQRKMGNIQRSLYYNTSSSGAIFDALERKSFRSNIGDSWEVDEYVGENQEICLFIRSNGNSIVGTPSSVVLDLDDEYIERYEAYFEEVRQEEERIASIPRRNPKMIVWGSILMFLGSVGLLNFAAGGEEAYSEFGPLGYLVMLSIIAGGILLFIFGMKKKVR